MVGLFAVGWLAPFYFTAVPEVRSAYISCGNISDDRPPHPCGGLCHRNFWYNK